MTLAARIAVPIAACALLAACVSVLPKAPPAAPRYLLAPVEFAEAVAPPAPYSLAIDDPLSTRVYDTTKMAMLRAPGRVEYLLGAEWADRAPRLFQSALIRSFENSGRILGVGDRITLPASQFVLQTDLRALHAAEIDGAATAVLTVYVRLSNGRRILGARLFEHDARVDGEDASSIAAAFDRAVGAALKEIVAWTFETADAAYAK